MSLNTLTTTDICNAALDMVSGQNIQDINDDTNPNAELCARHLPQVLKAELSKGEWSFARRFAKLALLDKEQNPELAVDGYYCYALPKDFARLSLYFFSEFYPYRTNQYQRHANYFLTSKCIYTRFPLVQLAYITDKPLLEELDPLFVDMVEAALAARIAPKIMGNDANTDFVLRLYKDAKHTAMRNGLLQMEASATGFSDTQIARVL